MSRYYITIMLIFRLFGAITVNIDTLVENYSGMLKKVASVQVI